MAERDRFWRITGRLAVWQVQIATAAIVGALAIHFGADRLVVGIFEGWINAFAFYRTFRVAGGGAPPFPQPKSPG